MIFVGIDVASKKHDCFLTQDETGMIYSKPFSIENDEEGYKKLHTAITNFVEQTNDSNVRIGLESTGHYSNNILNYFYKAGFQVALINPLLTNMDRKATSVRKTKTDKVDSQAICTFLQRNKYDFQPYTPSLYHIEALKSLTRQRFQLVKARGKYKTILNRLVTIVFPEYLKSGVFFCNSEPPLYRNHKRVSIYILIVPRAFSPYCKQKSYILRNRYDQYLL